jgi:hypothetical protein
MRGTSAIYFLFGLKLGFADEVVENQSDDGNQNDNADNCLHRSSVG